MKILNKLVLFTLLAGITGLPTLASATTAPANNSANSAISTNAKPQNIQSNNNLKLSWCANRVRVCHRGVLRHRCVRRSITGRCLRVVTFRAGGVHCHWVCHR
jgi:hypothetical protein